MVGNSIPGPLLGAASPAVHSWMGLGDLLPDEREGERVDSRIVLGIDEAGRGAVLGPLVVAGVALDFRKAGALTRLGVRDSKGFGAGARARTRRRALAEPIERIAERIAVRVFSAAEVDRYTEAGDLNVLERRAAAEIIEEISGGIGPIRRVVADGRRLFELLRLHWPRLEAVDGGESRHAAVAAASVVAKDRRDTLFSEIADRYRPDFGEMQGGGYTNAATGDFLRRYHARTGELPPETRRSWNWEVLRELRGAPTLF